MGGRVDPDTATPDTNTSHAKQPNTVAFSAGAVCCPGEASARRHDRAGSLATWIDLGTTQGRSGWNLTVAPAQRRWTR